MIDASLHILLLRKPFCLTDKGCCSKPRLELPCLVSRRVDINRAVVYTELLQFFLDPLDEAIDQAIASLDLDIGQDSDPLLFGQASEAVLKRLLEATAVKADDRGLEE